MTTQLHIRNFRGIQEGKIELAPITILMGANNSGKSSVIYSLLALKNMVSNPNQPLDSFFNFQFLNLGGFKESVFLKDDRKNIEVGITSTSELGHFGYSVTLGKTASRFHIEIERPYPMVFDLPVTLPYPLNAGTGKKIEEPDLQANITWNGITAQISIEKAEGVAAEISKTILSSLAEPVDLLRNTDFIPLKRGFTKPVYSAVPLQPQLISEDEMATFIANDRDLEGKIDLYLEEMVNKNFSVRPILGSGSFYLQTRDRKTGFVCDLVNDGFGTNQLVYLLAKSLRREQQTICIEEPEIHLHPEAVGKLASVLSHIALEDGRSFVITTHSEHFIISLLNMVVKGEITPTTINIYYVFKEKEKTKIEKQEVNEKGQIKGGLKGFYEVQLNEMREFLKISE